MTKEQITSEIAEIDRKIEALRESRTELCGLLGDLIAPFAVGDMIHWAVRRGRHEKSNVQRARVLRIEWRGWGDGYTAHVLRIRKDGTDGERVFISDYRKAVKEEAQP